MCFRSLLLMPIKNAEKQTLAKAIMQTIRKLIKESFKYWDMIIGRTKEDILTMIIGNITLFEN